MRTYTIVLTRQGRFWISRIRGRRHAAPLRTLTVGAARRAHSAVCPAPLRVHIDGVLGLLIDRAKTLRAQADKLEAEAAAAELNCLEALAAARVSTRDASLLLNLPASRPSRTFPGRFNAYREKKL